MITRKDDCINALGMAFFGMLFFLLVSSFSETPSNRTNETLKFELAVELHAASTQANGSDRIRLPAFGKNWISSVDRMNFRLFNYTLKLLADNSLVRQEIFYLDRFLLLLKQTEVHRFYYHLFSFDSREIPVLN